MIRGPLEVTFSTVYGRIGNPRRPLRSGLGLLFRDGLPVRRAEREWQVLFPVDHGDSSIIIVAAMRRKRAARFFHDNMTVESFEHMVCRCDSRLQSLDELVPARGGKPVDIASYLLTTGSLLVLALQLSDARL